MTKRRFEELIILTIRRLRISHGRMIVADCSANCRLYTESRQYVEKATRRTWTQQTVRRGVNPQLVRRRHWPVGG